MSDIANALDGMDEVQRALAEERAAQADAEGMAILGAMVEAAYIVAVSDGTLSEAETQTLIDGFLKLTDGDVDAEAMAGRWQNAGDGPEPEDRPPALER